MARRGDERERTRPADDAGDGAGTGGRADGDTATRAITRRRFVGLIAAGAGATLAGPALAKTPATKPKGTRPAGATTGATETLTPKVAKGLEEQRAALKHTLETLRGFELPPGSEQGFAFRPLAARRKP